MNKKAIFEAMDATVIERASGGLLITQTDGSGEEARIWIPGRFVELFIAECKRVTCD